MVYRVCSTYLIHGTVIWWEKIWAEIKADKLRRSGRNLKAQTVAQILKRYKKKNRWYYEIKYLSPDGTETPAVEIVKKELYALAPEMLKDFDREIVNNGVD